MGKKISRFLSTQIVQTLCRFILGGIFIYSSIDKIRNPYDFAQIIYDYQLLPDIFVYFVAVTLPWIEMVTGLFLISGVFTRTSSIILSSLLLAFIVAFIINEIRGFNLSCGCFSTEEKGLSDSLIILILRDMIMLIPGLVIIFFYKSKKQLHNKKI